MGFELVVWEIVQGVTLLIQSGNSLELRGVFLDRGGKPPKVGAGMHVHCGPLFYLAQEHDSLCWLTLLPVVRCVLLACSS